MVKGEDIMLNDGRIFESARVDINESPYLLVPRREGGFWQAVGLRNCYSPSSFKEIWKIETRFDFDKEDSFVIPEDSLYEIPAESFVIESDCENKPYSIVRAFLALRELARKSPPCNFVSYHRFDPEKKQINVAKFIGVNGMNDLYEVRPRLFVKFDDGRRKNLPVPEIPEGIKYDVHKYEKPILIDSGLEALAV
jgi:hypothetical protein